MVLSAGLGTRLRPLTEHTAKPLVPVGDRPALAHVLERLRAAGAPRVVVNAHHHAAQVAAFARAQAGDVRVSEETDLLGTSGGIAHARGLLGEGDVLVWNGDILAEIDVAGLVAAHRDAATLVVQRLPRGQGAVGLDGQGTIVRLRAEAFGDESCGGQFLGIYVLSAGLRERLVSPGGLIEDVLVPALARGEAVHAFEHPGAWHDIGTLPTYREANLAWLASRGLTSWAAPDASVAPSVVLDGSVVGAGARVTGRGTLARCVVWPAGHAIAPMQDQVVTPAVTS